MTTNKATKGGSDTSRQVVPNNILGTLMVVCVEVMFFGGLISTFVVAEAAASPEMWPPPDQPRLPVYETLINTFALVASGVLMVIAVRHNGDRRKLTEWLLLGSFALGAFFVGFQGYEWVALLNQGMTLTSSRLGSFFYLIVGMHGLHAIAGLGAVGWAYFAFRRRQLSESAFTSVSIFWYFVVLLWPILYWLVYL